MFASIRGAARAAANTHPLRHFRSLEERIGVVGFTLMLLFAMTHSLWAQEFTVGSVDLEFVIEAMGATGGHGSHTGHGG